MALQVKFAGLAVTAYLRSGWPRWRMRLTVAMVIGLVPLAVVAQVDVVVKGVEAELRANVRAYLSIAALSEPQAADAATPKATVEGLHRRAPGEIRRALEPFGYYDPKIKAKLRRREDGWRAVYKIQPGQPVIVKRVRIAIEGDAAEDQAFSRERADFALQSGKRLNHGDYEAAKQALMRLAAERGYLDAQWKARKLRINPGAHKAYVTLVFDSGPRYRFGAIRFSETVLSEAFLRRYLAFKPGDPFLAQRVLDLQYRLDDSGYFERVSVQPQRGQAANGRIPVEVALQARPKHRYTFGIGYGTDTGARVRLGRDTRYINARGHRFSTAIQLAQTSTEVSATYTIPLEQAWRERLEVDGSLTDEEIGDGKSRQYELGVRRITDSGGWRRTLSLEYQLSRDVLGDETDTRQLVLPGIQLSRSRFDDPIYATRGYRISGGVSGGSSTLGSDVSFIKTRLEGRGLTKVWPGGRVLGRLTVGRIWVDSFDELPLSQRFYAGGDNSVRGFDFQSLGPTDAQGRVIGGDVLGVASLEFEQFIWGNWGGAVFVDHGNALADLDGDLRTGAGVGLRYRSPVGVFRVDLAKAVDGDESPRLHLSLGVDL